jgi:hypothetical protein
VTDARLAELSGLRMAGRRTSKAGVLFPKDAER